MDEIMGTSYGYGTNDPKVYQSKLDGMDLSDLQVYAYENGIVPKDDRFALIDRLMAEFRRVTGLSRVDAMNAGIRNAPPIKIDAEMKRFLNGA